MSVASRTCFRHRAGRRTAAAVKIAAEAGELIKIGVEKGREADKSLSAGIC
jgi:hypothetical protein